ncbi:MAG: 50S ribosomal protein L7/L12 [bacterium]|nr:50S ribosomal protein L7/L12 [bacterium]
MAEDKKEEKTIKLDSKLQKIAEQLEGLTVVEMADLAKYLEEKFGVSAMPMMAPAAGAAAPAGEAPGAAEEKTSFTVVITASGDKKLAVIKAVRELRQDLGLMDAKKLVETPPQDVLVGVKKEEAENAKKSLEEAGATVELK